MTTQPPTKAKYLTNKELLIEIGKSKASYSYFLSPEYALFDVVVASLDFVTKELLEATILAKASKMSSKLNHVDPASIEPESIVFRVMTDSHLPPEEDEKKRKKSSIGEWVTKPNFPPFKHYIIKNGEPLEVGRSHWKNGLHNGQFCITHGKMSNRLAEMFMLLTDKYARGGSWRSYSYLDEMKCHALMHLSQVGLQFDESRSQNPFSFYTQVTKHCLAGETEILTREYGSIRIENVSEKDVHLLDGNGDWILCHIYDHGIQETQLNHFKGGNQKIGIWSTADHEWPSNGNKVKTRDFAGHNTKIDDLRPSKKIIDEESYRRGIVHGLVYGDGHRGQSKNSFLFRLCSHSESIIPYMTGYNSWPCSTTGYPIYYIGKAWADLKALPENPNSDLDYLLGFARGWFAADGCVDTDARSSLCAGIEEYEWLKQWGPLIGWHLNSYSTLAEETNYGPRIKGSLNIHLRKSSMDADDFLIIQHRERWVSMPNIRKGTVGGQRKYDWDIIKEMLMSGLSSQQVAEKIGAKVTAFRSALCQQKKAERENENFERAWHVYGSQQPDEKRLERVYCPVVPTTTTFALSCGIHSGNCFTRILNLEKRNQNIRDDLLIMAGVNPSFTRQVDNDMDQKDEAKTDGEEVKKTPARRGRKPGSGKAKIATEV